MSVLVVTSLGDIVIDLHASQCPITTKNFLKLCKIKYYNGCLFHTIHNNFLAQTGDPTGTGSGGDSFYKLVYGDQARFFPDEINLDLKHSKMGTVAMASGGENLNASQFYVTLRDGIEYLDGKHTVFGEVAEGWETLGRINDAIVDEKGRPLKDIRVKHTYVLDDPFDDPEEMLGLVPEGSPAGKPREECVDDVRLEDDWVPMEEKMDVREIEEVIREKEARSRAVVLETVGDIPDADVKPPENVLFVCKLNSVTEDEDLHTIFSRFGTVSSAQVIRDYKTGDSLCYAFIEFESNAACEQAYFKMDNALIDDRRIHVDFSQSVSKLWNQYRRKGTKQQGNGCFKCGELDHIAKDCDAGAGGRAVKQHQQQFVLKNDDHQRGGGDNARFDMVFDEENAGSPSRGKRQRERGKNDEMKSRRSFRDDKERGYAKEPTDRHRRRNDSTEDTRTDQHHKGRTENKNEDGRRPRLREDRSSPRRGEKDHYERSGDRHVVRDQRNGNDNRKTSRDDDSRRHEREKKDSQRRDRDGKEREKRYEAGSRPKDEDVVPGSRRRDSEYKRGREGHSEDGCDYDDGRGRRDDESHKRQKDDYGGSQRSRR
ncbi:hypothetical protein Droror1_Dr00007359 [Drosera rotundifolia]